MALITFYLGKIEPVLTSGGLEFDALYTPDWINNDLAKFIIKGIDNSEVICDRVIKSPVIGMIPPEYLSHGCKNVLLAFFKEEMDGVYLDGSKMGDNCYPILIEAAKKSGISVRVRVGRLLRDPWDEETEILMLPKRKIVKGYSKTLIYLALNCDLFYRGEGYGKWN